MHTSAHILFMDSSGVPPEHELLPRLHPEEQARYRGFIADARRRSWLGGRALALAALAYVSGKQADPAALRTAESGGLRYADGSLHLSLSHCRDLIGIVLSTMPVGLDIEWPRPRTSVDLAARVFTAKEAAWLDTLATAERLEAFYTLWTLKEAACKAVGLSLWQGLRYARFDPVAAKCALKRPFPSGEWAFIYARLEVNWRMALAIRSAPPEIECWRLTAPQQWRREPLVHPCCIYAR
jgi:phosphopantetheinyl transferase